VFGVDYTVEQRLCVHLMEYVNCLHVLLVTCDTCMYMYVLYVSKLFAVGLS